MSEEQVVRTEEQDGALRIYSGRGQLGDKRGGAGESEEGACCRLAAQLVASHYDLTLVEVAGRRRGSRRATRARHVAMYLAHVVGGLNLVAVGAGFHRDRTTASYACHMVEDARDDPAFDAALASLEIAVGILLDFQREERAT